jgi:hypothetical protein
VAAFIMALGLAGSTGVLQLGQMSGTPDCDLGISGSSRGTHEERRSPHEVTSAACDPNPTREFFV